MPALLNSSDGGISSLITWREANIFRASTRILYIVRVSIGIFRACTVQWLLIQVQSAFVAVLESTSLFCAILFVGIVLPWPMPPSAISLCYCVSLTD
jgi:hypothetical protein